MEEGADFGLARDRVLRQVETSLERLGVEQIDLYLTHEPDPDTPVEETYATFQALARPRLDRRAGACRTSAPTTCASGCELGTPALVQNSYSLLDRGDEAGGDPALRASTGSSTRRSARSRAAG